MQSKKIAPLPLKFLFLMATTLILSACDVAVESEMESVPSAEMGHSDSMEVESDDSMEVVDSVDSEGDAESATDSMEVDEVEAEEGLSVELEAEAVSREYAAGSIQDFETSVLESALESGEKVLLSFDADWCSVCKANEPIINGLLPSTDVVGLKVNYDTETALKSEYGVALQSTYIVLDGGEERRYTGALSEDKLRELIEG